MFAQRCCNGRWVCEAAVGFGEPCCQCARHGAMARVIVHCIVCCCLTLQAFSAAWLAHRHTNATHIQRCYRGYLARRLFTVMVKEELAMQELLEAAEAARNSAEAVHAVRSNCYTHLSTATSGHS